MSARFFNEKKLRPSARFSKKKLIRIQLFYQYNINRSVIVIQRKYVRRSSIVIRAFI